MKKLSYVLGLLAMTIMMTITSCSGDSKGRDKDISEDVQKYCDMFDECADMINDADSQQSLQDTFIGMQADEKRLQSKLDMETELTDDDREALLDSYMNYTSTFTYRLIDLGMGSNSRSEAEAELNKYENHVSEMLDECETLGDFINGL